MATLHENRLLFNSNVTVSHSGGNLSSDSGLILAKEFMNKFEFSQILCKNIQIQDDRLYHVHENESILEQIILQLIAGYPTDSSANILATDPIFQAVLSKKRLASQSSISRFWDRMSTENIVQLQKVNQVLIDKARTIRNTNEMIFDLDSTHSDTFGNQEMTDYNAHYQTTGYHPLVAFDGATGEIVAHHFSTSLKMNLVYETLDKLNNVIKDMPVMERYIHSDQGVHYTYPVFQEKVENMGLIQSMSRRGNCWDNAPMESFFGHMKDVVLSERTETLQDLWYAVEDYIEFYNNRRYHKKLKKMTPTAYRDHLLWVA